MHSYTHDVLQEIAAEKYPYLVDESGAWTVRKAMVETLGK